MLSLETSTLPAPVASQTGSPLRGMVEAGYGVATIRRPSGLLLGDDSSPLDNVNLISPSR